MAATAVLTNGIHESGLSNGSSGDGGTPNPNAPALTGKMENLTVNKGQKIEYILKITGQKPLTVNWYRNETVKLKSNKNMKVIYSMSQGETKMTVFEADAEDDGQYKVEAINQFGTATLTCTVQVILPEKIAGTVKQKNRSEEESELSELKKFQKRGSVVDALNSSNQRRSSSRGSITTLPRETLNVILEKKPVVPSKPSRPQVVDYDKDRVELKWTHSTDPDNVVESYEIQKRLKGGKWEKALTVTGDETTGLVLGLEEGQEYEFRLLPINTGGAGEASDPTDPVVTKARRVKPTIDRGSFKPQHVIKRGQEFTIGIKYTGEPHPKASWTKANKALGSNGIVKITEVDHTSAIFFQGIERKDAGIYKFTICNDHGTDSVDVEITVIGPPGSPKGPLAIFDVQKDSILIGWNPPDDDGGNPISGYVIEKRDVKAGQWEPQTHSVSADVTKFRVPELTEGVEYLFRVRAQNAEGLSDPLDSETATQAKNAFDVTKAPGKPQLVNCSRKFIEIKWEKPKQTGYMPLTPIGYNVKRRESKTESWNQVNTEPLMELQFKDNTVEAYKEYQYRITAVNDGLESVPSEPSNMFKACPLEEAPKIDLSALSGKEIRVKAGEQIKVDVPMTGSPLPVVTWQKDKKVVPPSDRVIQEASDEKALLHIPSAVRGDTGKYTITAKNQFGEDSGDFNVFVVEAPKIDLSELSGKEIRVKEGQQIKVEVPMTGSPTPVVTWQKEQNIVPPSDRVKQDTSNEKALLHIPSALRSDTGKYTITAKNELGEDSGNFNITVLSPPGRPKGPLDILDVQKDSVLIGWNPPDDDGGKPLTEYVIQKMNSKSGNWDSSSHSVGADETKFRVPHLKEGDSYDFRVRAKNDEGLSEPLDSDSATKVKNPFDPTDPPGKPEVVDSARNFIKIKWEKPKRDGGAPVTGYNVERKDPRSGTWSRVNDEPIKGEEFTDNTVVANKDYQYRVSAENEGGESKPSDPSNIITARPLREAPKVDLSGLLGREIRVRAGEQVKLDVPVTGTPVPAVTWQKEKKNITPSDRVRLENGEEKATFHIVSAIRSDTSNYTITAENKFGKDSGDFSLVVLDKPPAPSDLNVKDIFADHCTLTWKPPTDDGGAEIMGYIVERKEEEDDFWQTLPDIISSPTHVVKGLVKGSKYKFRVRAENIYGVGEPAETDRAILAKNPYDKPDAPGKPEVKDSDKDHITIIWAAPKKDGGSPITGYNIERKDPKANHWTKVNSEPLTVREFTDTKVIAGKEYEYIVKAENAGGESDPSEVSAPIKAKPLKAAPQFDKSALEFADNRVRAGNAVKIEVPIVGAPLPFVSWNKDGNDLEDSVHVQVIGEELAQLHIPCSKRSDTGLYNVVASNIFGKDSTQINIIVLDKPGPPENLQVSDIAAKNCKLSWQPPCDNGGAEILDYIVERCEDGSSFWKKAPGTVNGTSHVVKELEPGKKYKFRVKAQNVYGVGNPLETENPIQMKDACTAPQFESDFQEQSVDKGDTLKLRIPFFGSSPYSCKLKKGGREMSDSNDRVKLVPLEDSVVLQIKDARKDDTGRYNVEITNEAGTGTCNVPIKVKATPAQCSGLTVSNITKSGCRLRWRPPKDDGGARITNYIVDRQMVGKPNWTTVASFVKDVEYEVQGLVENKEYLFRVAAVNANGTGEWLVTPTSIVAKMPFGTPDAPGEPKAEEVGGDFVTLTWPKPRSDGGGRILGYFIEKREATSDNWIRVNQTPCPSTLFNVPNLIEDQEYDFRVSAVNEAGESRPTMTGRRILVKDPKNIEPDRAPKFPFPLRDRFIQEGHDFKLFASLEGWPKPVCTWSKDGRVLTHGDHYSIVYMKGVCSLEITSCKMSDVGRYTCVAQNMLGSAETSCKVDISAKGVSH
jgi:hypothetical protein